MKASKQLLEAVLKGKGGEYEVPQPTKKGMVSKKGRARRSPKSETYYISDKWYSFPYNMNITDNDLLVMIQFFKKNGFNVKLRKGAEEPYWSNFPKAAKEDFVDALNRGLDAIEQQRETGEYPKATKKKKISKWSHVHYLSNSWGAFRRITPLSQNEFRIIVEYLKRAGFKAKYKKGGIQPDINNEWPENKADKFRETIDNVEDVIEEYRRISRGANRKFRLLVANYCDEAWKADFAKFSGRSGSPEKIWKKFSEAEKYFLVFDLGFATEDGIPTGKAIDEGAKAHT